MNAIYRVRSRQLALVIIVINAGVLQTQDLRKNVARGLVLIGSLNNLLQSTRDGNDNEF